jgi:hypothetical protein
MTVRVQLELSGSKFPAALIWLCCLCRHPGQELQAKQGQLLTLWCWTQPTAQEILLKVTQRKQRKAAVICLLQRVRACVRQRSHEWMSASLCAPCTCKPQARASKGW